MHQSVARTCDELRGADARPVFARHVAVIVMMAEGNLPLWSQAAMLVVWEVAQLGITFLIGWLFTKGSGIATRAGDLARSMLAVARPASHGLCSALGWTGSGSLGTHNPYLDRETHLPDSQITTFVHPTEVNLGLDDLSLVEEEPPYVLLLRARRNSRPRKETHQKQPTA